MERLVMSRLDDFFKCVDESIEDGRTSLKCKLGLWSVEAKDSDSVYLEAFHYWQQYAGDGEYSSLIGGPTVIDKMMQFS
jgi:hypothetical protein